MNARTEPLYDVVGVGFGPSNLALAVALAEASPGAPAGPLSALFLERQPSFGWHRNMLLPSTTMQVSFLKDLATFRNPLSRFTFVNYLHTQGRLTQFVNNCDFFPTRAEFHRYLEWTAAQVGESVRYGSEVAGLHQVDGAHDLVQVTYRDIATGRLDTVHARNVVVSTGLVPRVPAGITLSPRIWHSSRFLEHFAARPHEQLRSVAVVGAGQSAAEITRFLHDECPQADIHAVLPVYGYNVADATPFANQVFDPKAVDDYYFGTDRSQQSFWQYHANTNYSVVDDDVIRDLYRRACHDDLMQRTRLHLHRMSRLTAAHEDTRSVIVTVDSHLDGITRELPVDALVLATGYEPMTPETLLGDLVAECVRDETGQLAMGRDYRVALQPRCGFGLYLQGGTEHSHGLSASLLSNIAVRSGEILDSIQRRSVSGDARELSRTAG